MNTLITTKTIISTSLAMTFAFVAHSAIADPVAGNLWVDHNLDTYNTEVGMSLDINGDGTSVFIAADKEGWTGIGIDQSIRFEEGRSISLGYEYGLYDEGYDHTVDITLIQQVSYNSSIYVSVGHTAASDIQMNPAITPDFEDVATNTFMTGINIRVQPTMTVGYNYTHEKIDSERTLDFRTNEHEAIIIKHLGDLNPYAKFTHINTSEHEVKNSNEVSIGLSYSF